MSAHDAAMPFPRPEFVRETSDTGTIGEIARPLSLWERVSSNTAARRIFILLVLAGAWEAYSVPLDNPLLFPTFHETVLALWNGIVAGEILARCWVSIKVLLVGYALGIAIAAVLTTFAVSTRIGTDFLSTLTSMFNPLPAIALLPLALLWFGLGNPSLIFVLIHSVLWPVSLNTHSGFLSVSDTLRMAGNNVGLRGIRYVVKLLIPAAFPSILTGLKIGWAFAWRTLIAAELVFGTSSGSGGLGWYIFENRNQLEVANVFAGLFAVIIIGLLVESVVFRAIEENTVRKWGMQR
jgi:NitT/TauT family transport system permease protein